MIKFISQVSCNKESDVVSDACGPCFSVSINDWTDWTIDWTLQIEFEGIILIARKILIIDSLKNLHWATKMLEK